MSIYSSRSRISLLYVNDPYRKVCDHFQNTNLYCNSCQFRSRMTECNLHQPNRQHIDILRLLQTWRTSSGTRHSNMPQYLMSYLQTKYLGSFANNSINLKPYVNVTDQIASNYWTLWFRITADFQNEVSFPLSYCNYNYEWNLFVAQSKI